MSDTKLRELERRWKETGSVEDEAAYLLERVRVGDLTRERLELAAYCDHPAARVALGEEAPSVAAGFRGWFVGLERWGKPVLVRAALAAARLSLSRWTGGAIEGDVKTAARAAEAWLACPCDRHLTAAREAAREAHFVAVDARESQGVDAERLLRPAAYAADAAADSPEPWKEHVALAPAWSAAYSAAGGDPHVYMADWARAKTGEQWDEMFHREYPPTPEQDAVLRTMRSCLSEWSLSETSDRPGCPPTRA